MVIFHSICKRLPEDHDFVAVAVLRKLHRLTTGGTSVADQAIDIGGILYPLIFPGVIEDDANFGCSEDSTTPNW